MARRKLALNVPVQYPQCLPWWCVLTRVADGACSLCYCRCWWVSGAECALWAESHVLQYERKLPVHPDALSTRLPTGSCVRVCLAFSSQTCFWKSFFLSLLDQQPLSAVMFHSQEVNSPPGIESYDVFLLQWTGKKWAHPAAATAAETITLICRVSWSKSPQHVIHQTTSRILPRQEAFYRAIEPAFLWNCLISVGVASGFSGLSAVRALQEVSWLLWGWVNMTPWERGGEQRWVSGLSIHIASCLRILLSETLSFLGSE